MSSKWNHFTGKKIIHKLEVLRREYLLQKPIREISLVKLELKNFSHSLCTADLCWPQLVISPPFLKRLLDERSTFTFARKINCQLLRSVAIHFLFLFLIFAFVFFLKKFSVLLEFMVRFQFGSCTFMGKRRY